MADDAKPAEDAGQVEGMIVENTILQMAKVVTTDLNDGSDNANELNILLNQGWRAKGTSPMGADAGKAASLVILEKIGPPAP